MIIYYLSDESGQLSSIGKKVLTELVATLESLCDVVLLSGREPMCVEQCANWWTKVCKEYNIGKLLWIFTYFSINSSVKESNFDLYSTYILIYISEDSGCAKKALECHLKFAFVTNSRSESVFRSICADIRIQLGTLDEDEEEEESPSQQDVTYKFLSPENATILLVS